MEKGVSKTVVAELQHLELAVMDTEIALKQLSDQRNWREVLDGCSQVVLSCQKLILRYARLAQEFVDALPLYVLKRLFGCVEVVFSHSINFCIPSSAEIHPNDVGSSISNPKTQPTKKESAKNQNSRLPSTLKALGGAQVEPFRGIDTKLPTLPQISIPPVDNRNEAKQRYDDLMVEIELDHLNASAGTRTILSNNLWNELGKYEEFIGRCQQSATKLMDTKNSDVVACCNIDMAFSNIEDELQRKRNLSECTNEKLQELMVAYKAKLGALKKIVKGPAKKDQGIQVSYYCYDLELKDLQLKVKTTANECQFQRKKTVQLEKRLEMVSKQLESAHVTKSKMEQSYQTLQSESKRNEQLCRAMYNNMLGLETESFGLRTRLQRIQMASIQEEVEAVAGGYTLQMRIRLVSIVEAVLKRMGIEYESKDKWIVSIKRPSDQSFNWRQLKQFDLEVMKKLIVCNKDKEFPEARTAAGTQVVSQTKEVVKQEEKSTVVQIETSPPVQVIIQQPNKPAEQPAPTPQLRPRISNEVKNAKNPKKTLMRYNTVKPTYRNMNKPTLPKHYDDQMVSIREEEVEVEKRLGRSKGNSQYISYKPTKTFQQQQDSKAASKMASSIASKSIIRLPSSKRLDEQKVMTPTKSKARSVKQSARDDTVAQSLHQLKQERVETKQQASQTVPMESDRNESDHNKEVLISTHRFGSFIQRGDSPAEARVSHLSDLQQKFPRLSASRLTSSHFTFDLAREIGGMNKSRTDSLSLAKLQVGKQMPSRNSTPEKRQSKVALRQECGSNNVSGEPSSPSRPSKYRAQEHFQSCRNSSSFKGIQKMHEQADIQASGPLPIDYLKRLDPAKWNKVLINDKKIAAGLIMLVKADRHLFVKHNNVLSLLRDAERMHLRSCGSNRCEHLLNFYRMLGCKVMTCQEQRKHTTMNNNSRLNCTQSQPVF